MADVLKSPARRWDPLPFPPFLDPVLHNHHGTNYTRHFSCVSRRHHLTFRNDCHCLGNIKLTVEQSRTPPSTGSVALYGSWDNFSTPYPMQRDARTGPEHWSGCHSFSNIICDGHVLPSGSPRNGGLKMGGTYWYYVCPRNSLYGVHILHNPFFFLTLFSSTNSTTIWNSTILPNHPRLYALYYLVNL